MPKAQEILEARLFEPFFVSSRYGFPVFVRENGEKVKYRQVKRAPRRLGRWMISCEHGRRILAFIPPGGGPIEFYTKQTEGPDYMLTVSCGRRIFYREGVAEEIIKEAREEQRA